ncbi:MAG: arginine repressor [Clostridiales Family XIII bacterium]|jgi:transcriptional regulator of arginine metabolism|nr:arginine repressor [Clostridiales Family XIII bacterium]
MRYTRQNKIVELIAGHEIDTQEKLAEYLKKSGFDVTQATVSRDIKELQLVKALAPSGQYKYTLADVGARQATARFVKIFKDTIQTAAHSGNMIVVKTLTGCANAACEAIDSLEFPHILGSIAGDSTIFIVVEDQQYAPALVARFQDLLKQ